MANKMILAPEVELDLEEACSWYEKQRAGLGRKFLVNAADAVRQIAQFPESHRFIVGTYRRGLVRRFPFAIIYEFAGETVTVYGIFHTASDPAKWRRRLP